MKYKCKDGTVINLAPEVKPEYFYSLINLTTNAGVIMDLFKNRNYDVSVVPGSFLRILTASEKELSEIASVLDEIEKLGLRAIFNANLDARSFKSSFIARVKMGAEKGIPFVNADNTFINELKDEESFKAYTEAYLKNKTTTSNTEEAKELDAEDLTVKSTILSKLSEINSLNSDVTLTFIVSSIIANLDTAIANNNKAYRNLGCRPIIEGALKGVDLTSDMQELIDTKILAAFPDMNMERGI